MTTPPVRRRKPKAARKTENILIRVTATQKRQLGAAAERAGLDLSSWLRSLGLRAAQQDGGDGPDQAGGAGDARG